MKRHWKSALAVGIAISLTGCGGGGVCSGARVISLSRKDVLTEETKAGIISANEYYEKQGCFSAPNPEPNLFGNAAAAIGLK